MGRAGHRHGKGIGAVITSGPAFARMTDRRLLVDVSVT